MLSSLISWGLSLIFTGLLVREISKRVKADYRALGAATYLGLGSVWALGLSSSAALLQATKTSIPPALLPITGVIPLTQTIFLWQSMVMASVAFEFIGTTAMLDPTKRDRSGDPAAEARDKLWLERPRRPIPRSAVVPMIPRLAARDEL